MKEFTAPEKAKVAVLTGKKNEIKELKYRKSVSSLRFCKRVLQ